MSTPNKFWFHHCRDKNNIYFAEGDEYEYVISGSDIKNIALTSNLVESFIDVGDWVLTVPNKFKVKGVMTGNIYSLIKDANNLYVMSGENLPSRIFHYEQEVLSYLYGDKPVWEVYTEEKIKELTTPDTFKFRHWSDRALDGQIFSATRCNGGYRVEWADVNTGESFKRTYCNKDVECHLSGGDWIVVEEVFAKEEPSVKKPSDKKPSAKKLISINVNSVRAAAEFDATNNKHTIKKNISVEEIEQEILKYVREMYSGLMSGEFDWKYRVIGTRSYVVRFRDEDENYGVISVEVDPSIGMPSFYASVEDFLNQN